VWELRALGPGRDTDVGTIDKLAGLAGATAAHAGVIAHAEAPAAATPLRDAVSDALARGRLLHGRGDAQVARIERILGSGDVDEASRRPFGDGMNGPLARVKVADPADPFAEPTLVVEKPASAQAAQEELGWRLAKAMGIDHLVAAVVRRADGTARIEFRSGVGLSQAGVIDIAALDKELARAYLHDASLGLTAAEAAHAGRVERQLLQVFDYLLANNDRRPPNGLVDAVEGVTFIDTGHAGRGALPQNGGTTSRPALHMFQAGKDGGRVEIDAEVVAYLRSRLTSGSLADMHSAVFDAPGIAGPLPHTIGERFAIYARSPAFRDGMSTRLDHLFETGGYTHHGWKPDTAGELPPLVDDRRIAEARGLGGVRGAMRGPGGMF
jgi:hypothetical protein